MFSDNLPFADFIRPNVELMRYVVSIMTIIFLIIVLASGNVTGAGPYFYLISSIIATITSVVVTQLYKY